MRIVSYYCPAFPSDHFKFWDTDIGVALPKLIAEDCRYVLIGDKPEYPIVDRDADISYCQLFSRPTERPQNFVYTFLSDFIGHEHEVIHWMRAVRPNLFMCLQHCPTELIELGEQVGCKVVLVPWFVSDVPQMTPKTLKGLCSGCIDPLIYPKRSQMYRFLKGLGRLDIKLSGSPSFGNYPLTAGQYFEALSRAQYYFSGGIYDTYIPPKYYEAAAYGACLVTFDMPEDRKSTRLNSSHTT